jgi:hypothetical protein
MEQFEIRADNKKNRFYCILKGFFLESEIDLALNNISSELLNLSGGYDVIIDIQEIKTSPEHMKKVLYEKLMHLIKSDCRYIFDVNPGKSVKPVKKFLKATHENLNKIRSVSYIKEAEDFLEQDFLLKNPFYN